MNVITGMGEVGVGGRQAPPPSPPYAPFGASVGASLMKGEDFTAPSSSPKRGGCAALCPLLTTLAPYLASPLNSPSDILFIKSFHIPLCRSAIPFYILLLSEL